jgi:hypothetical protein
LEKGIGMRNALYVGLLIIAVTLVGCKNTMLVHDYIDQPVPSYAQETSTTNSLEKSIVSAAISLGWTAQVVDQANIIATLKIRTHRLVVDISHDDKSFSIKYKDSTNLLYDGENIHRQYDNWINNLINSINAFTVSG